MAGRKYTTEDGDIDSLERYDDSKYAAVTGKFGSSLSALACRFKLLVAMPDGERKEVVRLELYEFGNFPSFYRRHRI